jgi:hypothetical protein
MAITKAPQIVTLWNSTQVLDGAGDPSAAPGLAAPQGAVFLRRDGGASTTLYVKTGPLATDWTAK